MAQNFYIINTFLILTIFVYLLPTEVKCRPLLTIDGLGIIGDQKDQDDQETPQLLEKKTHLGSKLKSRQKPGRPLKSVISLLDDTDKDLQKVGKALDKGLEPKPKPPNRKVTKNILGKILPGHNNNMRGLDLEIGDLKLSSNDQGLKLDPGKDLKKATKELSLLNMKSGEQLVQDKAGKLTRVSKDDQILDDVSTVEPDDIESKESLDVEELNDGSKQLVHTVEVKDEQSLQDHIAEISDQGDSGHIVKEVAKGLSDKSDTTTEKDENDDQDKKETPTPSLIQLPQMKNPLKIKIGSDKETQTFTQASSLKPSSKKFSRIKKPNFSNQE